MALSGLQDVDSATQMILFFWRTQRSKKSPKNKTKPRLRSAFLVGYKWYYKSQVWFVLQILIRFLIERGRMPIPKSVHRERIKENFDIFSFQFSDDDLRQLDALDRNLRYFTMDRYVHVRQYSQWYDSQ